MKAQQRSADLEAAHTAYEAACQQAEYHDSLSLLMKQAADSAMNTLHHERIALVRLQPLACRYMMWRSMIDRSSPGFSELESNDACLECITRWI